MCSEEVWGEAALTSLSSRGAAAENVAVEDDILLMVLPDGCDATEGAAGGIELLPPKLSALRRSNSDLSSSKARRDVAGALVAAVSAEDVFVAAGGNSAGF